MAATTEVPASCPARRQYRRIPAPVAVGVILVLAVTAVLILIAVARGPGVPSPPVPAQIHTVVPGGMPGWQITLIAIGAALAGAALAMVLDRTVTSRKYATPTAA